VCSCCPATPATTATTTTTTKTTTAATTVNPTNISTGAHQTATEGTGERSTTRLTSIRTQTPSGTTAISSSLPTKTKKNDKSAQDPSSATQRGGLDLLLLSAIIAGAVAVVCILGILLFCLWRRKRSESLNQARKSPPPTDIVCLEHQSRETRRRFTADSQDTVSKGCTNQSISKESFQIPIQESIPYSDETHLHHVLEGPNDTSPDQAIPPNERWPTHTRADSVYDEPAENESYATICPTAKARENDVQYEAVGKDRNPKGVMYDTSNSASLNNSVDYCYSYSVANEEIRLHEDPNGQSIGYHVLENPNAGYQALENSAAKEKSSDGAVAASGYELTRGIDPSDYLPLNKTTQSFYHPLKKTNELARRAFTRK